jgi:4-amino-4-deoxy-L-arabinose transferase-like glycosyltransferase
MEEIAGEIKPSSDEKEIEKRKLGLKKFCLGWIKDNYDKIFIAVLILAFIIRLWLFFKTMDQTLWWDEADYLATGKKWGLGLGINEIWYYRRGFFWPVFAALFFKLGLGEIAMRFSVALFSTGIVAVSYFLIAKMFNKKLALLTSIGITLSWIIMFFTGRVLTDIPSAFFILLALLFFWKGYVLKEGNKFLYLFAVFLALAVMTRMQMLMFLPPFFIIILIKEKFKFIKNKKLWIVLGIFLLILLPNLYIYFQHFGNPITDILHYYGGVEGIPSMTGESGEPKRLIDLPRYFLDLPYSLTIPIFVLFIIGLPFFFGNMILGLDKVFKNEEVAKKVFVLSWIVISFLALGLTSALVEQRYITAVLPFLFLIAASAIEGFGKIAKNKFKINDKVISILVVIIFVLALIPSYSWGVNLTESKYSSYAEVKEAGLWIKENSNSSDLVISASMPQIQYYSERSTYPFSLAYRREIPQVNQTGFEEFVKTKKPKYLILSVFESHEPWQYSYPENNSDIWTPVKAYSQNNQPVLVIYELNNK